MQKRLKSIIDWLATRSPSVLVAILVTVLAVWGFIAIADEVKEGATHHFDDWAIRALRKPGDPNQPIGPRWMAEVGRDLTGLGGVAVLSLVTGAVVGFLLIREKYRATCLVLVATLGALLLSTLLKSLYNRPRPNLVLHLSDVYTSSFPSGHSMLSASVYMTLGTLLARLVEEKAVQFYFIAVALLLTFLVGISRVYMGVHYPTDVLAGWAAGIAWALVVWLGARYLQHRGAVERHIEH